MTNNNTHLVGVSRRFHSIKRLFGAQGVRLKWAEGTEDGGWTVKSVNDPHPCTTDFLQAFDALAAFVDAPLGHTAAQQLGRIVLGVEIKYTKEGEESVYVTVTRLVEGYQPVNITLGKFANAGEFEYALEDLITCANLYLDGNKLQLELPDGADESDTEQQQDLLAI